jgi:hypothetical protein
MSEASAADIPILTAIIQDQSKDREARDAAATSLVEVAQQNPDYRGQCVAILTSTLERYQRNPIELNTSLISHLMTLKASESAGLIQQVVKAGEYDRAMGDWTRISRGLGVQKRPAPAGAMAHAALPNASSSLVSSDKPVEFFSPDPAAAAATIAAGPRLTSKERERLRARKKQERKARKQNRRR